MVRVTNYFDTQVRVPSTSDTAEHIQQLNFDQEPYTHGLYQTTYPLESNTRKMTDQQIISWYSKVLESVRLRYRKLQRFARSAIFYIPHAIFNIIL